MGNIKAIPLWTALSKYIPFFLIVIILFNIFNVWRVFLKLIGFEKYTFKESRNEGDSKKGMEIVRKN